MNDYDSDYNSDSDSVGSENQPLEINILQATCRRVQNTELFSQVKVYVRFFVFILVSNLHRFCIVLPSIPGFYACLLACISFLALFKFSSVSSSNFFLPCVY